MRAKLERFGRGIVRDFDVGMVAAALPADGVLRPLACLPRARASKTTSAGIVWVTLGIRFLFLFCRADILPAVGLVWLAVLGVDDFRPIASGVGDTYTTRF